MAVLRELKTIMSPSAKLTVLETEEDIAFQINRVFYIYDIAKDTIRGGHRHRKNIQALVCVSGNCEVYINNGAREDIFYLDNPKKCLLLDPKDWHKIYRFSDDAILLVLASEHYDVGDYIDEEYE
jgi:dTDP-4-dehydrorhamnose 3,5-epimerase-like enzyme